MRVERQEDGWWLLDVPPYSVDGQIYTSCGPYATKAEALEDKRGLSEFFREHPEYQATLLMPQECERRGTAYATHWFVKSLGYRPPRLRSLRRVRFSPGQRWLPGIDAGEDSE